MSKRDESKRSLRQDTRLLDHIVKLGIQELLAGREIAYHYKSVPRRAPLALWRMVSLDLGKATLGLLVSIALALGLPELVQFVK